MKMPLLLALGALAASAMTQNAKFDGRLVGTWVPIAPKPTGKSSLQIDAKGRFKIHDESIGPDGKNHVTDYSGTVRVVPTDETKKGGDGEETLLVRLSVTPAEAKRLGINGLDLKDADKRKVTEIPVMGFVFLADLPALSDGMTTVFAPKGKEKQVEERYAALMKKVRKPGG